MTEDELYRELGIEAADTTVKESVLVQLVKLTDMRLLELAADLVDEQQAEDLQRQESPEAIAKWLSENAPELVDAYDAIVRETVAELKEQLAVN